jgi:hypothetical protein
MLSPCCGVATIVTDSRRAGVTDAEVRRRRQCPSCGKRYTTREKIVEAYERQGTIADELARQIEETIRRFRREQERES